MCFYLNSRTTGIYQSLFFPTHVRGSESWHYKGAADTHQGEKKVKRASVPKTHSQTDSELIEEIQIHS